MPPLSHLSIKVSWIYMSTQKFLNVVSCTELIYSHSNTCEKLLSWTNLYFCEKLINITALTTCISSTLYKNMLWMLRDVEIVSYTNLKPSCTNICENGEVQQPVIGWKLNQNLIPNQMNIFNIYNLHIHPANLQSFIEKQSWDQLIHVFIQVITYTTQNYQNHSFLPKKNPISSILISKNVSKIFMIYLHVKHNWTNQWTFLTWMVLIGPVVPEKKTKM